MTRQILAAFALMIGICVTPVTMAADPPPRLKDAIVGNWTLVSLRATRPDGGVVMPYGPHAAGMMTFGKNGRFAIILINPDLPKYASNDREKPAPAEALAVATGSTATFGSYTVDGAARTVALHVDASSYPNDNGASQIKTVKSISDDGLVLDTAASTNGGTVVELTLKRAD